MQWSSTVYYKTKKAGGDCKIYWRYNKLIMIMMIMLVYSQNTFEINVENFTYFWVTEIENYAQNYWLALVFMICCYVSFNMF